MTQDFAKIRPEPLLERKTVATPPAWSLMFTGVILGMALGVFGCFLFYLSGNVPPLAINQPVNNNTPSANQPPTIVAPKSTQLETKSAYLVGVKSSLMSSNSTVDSLVKYSFAIREKPLA